MKSKLRSQLGVRILCYSNTKMQQQLKGHAVCTPHASINLSGKTCLVPWKTNNTTNQVQQLNVGDDASDSEDTTTDQEDPQPNEDVSLHT